MSARGTSLSLALLLLVPSAAAVGGDPTFAVRTPTDPFGLSVEWYCGRVAVEERPPQEQPPKEPAPQEEVPPKEQPAQEEEPSQAGGRSVESAVDVNACVRAIEAACAIGGLRCCAQEVLRPCEAWNAVAGPWFQVGQEIPVVGGGVCVTAKSDPQANLSVEDRNCWERPPQGSVQGSATRHAAAQAWATSWHLLA